jgi:DNA-binding CsgD family transcriptional regulator
VLRFTEAVESSGAPTAAADQAAPAIDAMCALGLTPREAHVLFWVAQGKTNPQIGLILGVSRRTVQKHLEHTFQKLGVETRTAAIVRVMESLDAPAAGAPPRR